MVVTYSELPNKLVKAANGVDYAYREAGQGTVPLILLRHFGGNLDNWDPALIDALAATRRVVTFDNAGVGGSTGTTPDTIGQMARDVIAFLAAMEFGQADCSWILHRQLRRAGHRPDQAGCTAKADPGIVSSAGRDRNARLGRRRHRRGRRTRG
jgi:hypothetical protein